MTQTVLSSLRVGVVVVGLAAAAACGSPEAPRGGTPSPAANPSAPATPPKPTTVEGYSEVPLPAGEWTDKVADLEADLQNMSAGHKEAAGDFAGDLEALAESSEIKPRRQTLDAVAKELAAVMPKATNGDVLRQRLAQLFFVATRRAPLPDARMTQLPEDVQKLLTAHGVPEPQAKSIATHVSTIARESKRTTT